MKEQIRNIIKDAFNEIVERNGKDDELMEGTTFIGTNGVFDSMDLVNFLVIVEDNVNETLDKNMSLVSDKAFSRKKSPFYNLESLTDYIIETLGE